MTGPKVKGTRATGVSEGGEGNLDEVDEFHWDAGGWGTVSTPTHWVADASTEYSCRDWGVQLRLAQLVPEATAVMDNGILTFWTLMG